MLILKQIYGYDGFNQGRIDNMPNALLLVDIQPDFMPGGGLAVAEGDEILCGAAALLANPGFHTIVATQDWHPANHISLASNHPDHQPFDVIELYGHEQTLWPDHCIQDSDGAALHTELALAAVDLILRKGADPAVDSYSAFRNNYDAQGIRPSTGLVGYLRDRSVDAVFICGLARDFCVSWTAMDSVAAGFDTTIIWDLTRSVDPSGDAELEKRLTDTGIHIVQSTHLALEGNR